MGSNKAVKTKIKGNGFVVFITVVLTLVAVFIGLGSFFKVANIEVTGNDNYTAEEIIAASGLTTGENMLTLDDRTASNKVCSELDFITDASVTREYPSNVVIDVTEDTPMAYVNVNGKTWTLNSALTLYEPASISQVRGLIQLRGIEVTNPIAGRPADLSGGATQLKCTRELLAAIRENGLEGSIKYADMSNIGAIGFDLNGKYTVNLGSDGTISDKVAMLVGAVDKLDGNENGKLEFTSETELHFIPLG